MESLTHSNQIWRFGVFEADAAAGELLKHGVRIKLQEQPFQILLLLLEHPGELVTREDLRHKLWTDHTFVDFDRSLNTAITKLRLALCDSAENPRFIETVPRRGYRFICPVAVKSADIPGSEVGQHSVPESRAITGANQIVKPGMARKRDVFRPWYIAVAIIILVGVIAVYLFRLGGAKTATITPVVARRSVAVLGFKNLTGDSQHAWLSTALSDWLSAELGAGEQLRTIPEENVARMKIELALSEVDSLSKDSLGRIRRNLGTDLVVIGSYASLANSGNNLRVDIHLQDTATGETIATISQTGTEAQLLDLISRSGERLRATLGVHPVTAEESTSVAVVLPSNPEAARFYSEGLARLRFYDALTARDMFQKTIASEPDFALGHSALSTTLSSLGYDAGAIAQGKKADELSSKLPRAQRLLVQARYYQVSKNWERAIETYRTLFDFFPDGVDYGIALAQAQVSGGKGKDALQTVAILHTLPPPMGDDARVDLAESSAADSQGDLKQALNAADRAADKARSADASLLVAQALMIRSHMLQGLGRLSEAADAVAESERIFQAAGDRDELARAEAQSAHLVDLQGDFANAKQMYEKSLGTFREIGDLQGAETELNNIGVELQNQGDLIGAKENFSAALAASTDVNDQWGEAFARVNLAEILFDLGDLAGARQMYERSTAICDSIGNKDLGAYGLAGLAQVLQAQGDSKAAWQDEKRARSIFAEVGQVHTDVDIAAARLMLQMGSNDEALEQAHKALDLVNKAHMVTDLPAAEATLAEALLAKGQWADARSVSEKAATALGNRSTFESRLRVEIAIARVLAASKEIGDRNGSQKELRLVIDEAKRARFIPEEFEARLVLSEFIAADSSAKSRTEFLTLEHDSSSLGWTSIARRAGRELSTQVDSSK